MISFTDKGAAIGVFEAIKTAADEADVFTFGRLIDQAYSAQNARDMDDYLEEKRLSRGGDIAAMSACLAMRIAQLDDPSKRAAVQMALTCQIAALIDQIIENRRLKKGAPN